MEGTVRYTRRVTARGKISGGRATLDIIRRGYAVQDQEARRYGRKRFDSTAAEADDQHEEESR
jgi:hypothetical protein